MNCGLLLRLTAPASILIGIAAAQEQVSLPSEDGGLVYADVYGSGDRGVVLAHEGRFNKESWRAQALALNGRRVSSSGDRLPRLRQVPRRGPNRHLYRTSAP